jgi:phage terminase large subunit GpA-like protein
LQEWVQIRPRNETLDCLVYALAAHRMSNWTGAVAPVAAIPKPTPAAQQQLAPRTQHRSVIR